MKTYEETREEMLRDPVARAEYEAYSRKLEEQMLLKKIAEARKRRKVTQEQVAASMGTTREVVARLESPRRKSSPSLRTLQAYAEACGVALNFSVRPSRRTTISENEQ